MSNQDTMLQYINDGTIKHDLKTLPEYFKDVYCGKKGFELRIDDMDYQVGDVFCLREWDGEYTGKYYINSIVYVLRDCPQFGLKEGYCIFGW